MYLSQIARFFPDSNHFVLNQPEWQEIAVFIQKWNAKLTA
jgi:hypothetical protein